LSCRAESGHPELQRLGEMIRGDPIVTVEVGDRPCDDESFNGEFRDQHLSLQWFRNRADAKVSIEEWRRHYNEVRPHSSLAYLTPAAFKTKHLAGGDKGRSPALPARADMQSGPPSIESKELDVRPPNEPWRELPTEQSPGGFLSFYYADHLSELPVRGVTLPQTTRATQILKTKSHGLFSICGHGMRAGVVKRGCRYIIFMTRQQGRRVVTGYYRIRWYAGHYFIDKDNPADWVLAADARDRHLGGRRRHARARVTRIADESAERAPASIAVIRATNQFHEGPLFLAIAFDGIAPEFHTHIPSGHGDRDR
jgi:hypothetical protein